MEIAKNERRVIVLIILSDFCLLFLRAKVQRNIEQNNENWENLY